MDKLSIVPMGLVALLTITCLRKSRTWFCVITGFFALNSLLRFAAWLWISSQESPDALAPVFRFVIRTEPDSHFLLLFFFAALLLRESKAKKQS